MKVKVEKYKAPNIGRVFMSLTVSSILYIFKIDILMILIVSYIHLFFSILWLVLIETEIILEKKTKYLGLTPLILDNALITILMFITGNIFSFFSIGYIVLTAISSINNKKTFGILSIILTILSFSLIGFMSYLNILPVVNIFSETKSTVELFPLCIGIFSISSAVIVVFYISFRSINDNMKLNTQLKRQKKNLENYLKAYRRDLDLAKRIQRSLLNSDFIKRDNLEIKIRFSPMNEVGGDIYDIFEIKEGLIRIFIADATGHGVQAALITMAIKSEYENFKSVIESPGDLLQVLNSYFSNKYKTLKAYFSCIVADIYLEENYIRYASAGHPSQIFFSENQIVSLENSGKLMGINPQLEFSTKEFNFTKPSRFLFFTDGVFEGFTNAIDPFGEDSFHKYLLENPTFNTDKLTEKIETKRSISNQKDDITLISVKLT